MFKDYSAADLFTVTFVKKKKNKPLNTTAPDAVRCEDDDSKDSPS